MLKNPFKTRGFLFLWCLSFSLNIITFLIIYFKSGLHGSNVALKYTVRAGVLWYGDGKNLFSLPIVGLAVNFLNFFIYKKIPQSETLLLGAAIFTSLLVQVLLLIAVLFLISVN